MQQFSGDRPGSGQRSHHRSFLYGWLAPWAGHGSPRSDNLASLRKLPASRQESASWLVVVATAGAVGPINAHSAAGCWRCLLAGFATRSYLWTSRRPVSVSVSAGDCIPSTTFPAGRCAAKPCQLVLAPRYSEPGRKWLLRLLFRDAGQHVCAYCCHTSQIGTSNISPGSDGAVLCKLIWAFQF